MSSTWPSRQSNTLARGWIQQDPSAKEPTAKRSSNWSHIAGLCELLDISVMLDMVAMATITLATFDLVRNV